MPELPEVETVKRTLAPIVGAVVDEVWWSGKNLRANSPVDFVAIRSASCGAAFESIRRIGKYLLLDLCGEENAILIHLGMSGRLRYFHEKSVRPKHTHMEWKLRDGRVLRFTDPRRFGQVALVCRGREREHPSLAALGPDPIVDGINSAALHVRCKQSKRAIKLVLLDQSIIAGIGNIYASEALWVAKLHPKRRAADLTASDWRRLVDGISDVFQRALENGGTSLKDFVSADGNTGEHSHYLWVYGREGEDCLAPTCVGTVHRFVQQKRASFYCPRCQLLSLGAG